MYSIDDLYSACYSYGAACLGFLTSEYFANKFLMYGSVLLVAARLCYEVPKAVRTLRSKWGGK